MFKLLTKKSILIFVMLLFVVSVSYIAISKKLCAVQDMGSFRPQSAEFNGLQAELNKEKHKKKVLARFEVEGLRGLTVEDISLTLLDYSYHILNDSGKPEPFVTVSCKINIGKFEKGAENLKAHLKSTGMQAPIHIQLPDPERIIIGLFDNIKDEFITFASLPKSMKPVVQFAELRKKKPEYMIFTIVPDENNIRSGEDIRFPCSDCDMVKAFSTAVFGFNEKNKNYHDKILDIKTYRRVDPEDDIENRIGYIDKSTVSWSDWINDEYRELIVSTEREPLNGKTDAKPEFKNKKEVYTWINDKELSLVERIVDGQSILNLRTKRLSTVVAVTLKDGELYEISETGGDKKITSTNGKINSYLLSPDKHYVAYSIIVGYTNDVGLYEEGEEPGQVPVYHIVIMDIDLKKILKEIKPPNAEADQFIYASKWISNDELLLYDACGFSVDTKYIYNAGTNELRRADIQEEQMDL